MFSSYVYYLKVTYLERLIYCRNTKRYTFHCCPVTIMKKFVQLILHFIGLEVLDDEPVFSGIARHQE